MTACGATLMEAYYFASAAHAAVGQLRKYTNEPYIVHPLAVRDIIYEFYPDDREMLVAAMLHDVVEDTQIGLDLVERLFGTGAAILVDWVTETQHPKGTKRAVRKAADREKLARAPGRAQSLKVADLIDNTRSIVRHDPEFARIYLVEKKLALDVMTHAHPILRQRALDLVTFDMEQLGVDA